MTEDAADSILRGNSPGQPFGPDCNGPRDCVGTERGCRHCAGWWDENGNLIDFGDEL